MFPSDEADFVYVPVPKERLGDAYRLLAPLFDTLEPVRPVTWITSEPVKPDLTESLIHAIIHQDKPTGRPKLVLDVMADHAETWLTVKDLVELTGLESGLVSGALGSIGRISKRVGGRLFLRRSDGGGRPSYFMTSDVAARWLRVA